METFTVVLWLCLFAQLALAKPVIIDQVDRESTIEQEPVTEDPNYVPIYPLPCTTTTTRRPILKATEQPEYANYVDPPSSELASSYEGSLEIVMIT